MAQRGRPKKTETKDEKRERIVMDEHISIQQPYERMKSIFNRYNNSSLTDKDFVTAMGNSFASNPFIQNARLKRINSPITQSDKKQLDRALISPESHESVFRSESQSLYFQNYVYNILTKMNREVPQYYNYVTPVNVNVQDCKSETFKKEYHYVTQMLEAMNLRKVGKDIAIDVALEGKRSYVFRYGSDKPKGKVYYAKFQKLPSQWVKYTAIGSDTDYITSLDFMMFLQPGESIDYYPPFFRTIWEELIEEGIFIEDGSGNKILNPVNVGKSKRVSDVMEIKDGRYFYWVQLPQEEVFEFGSDDSNPLQLPDTVGLFSDLRGLDDYKWLQNQLISKAVNSVLVGTVPLIKDHNLAGGDQTAISMDSIIGFSDMFSQAVSNNILPFFAPFTDYQLLSLPLPPDAKEINNTALKNLINSSGMGALMSTTDKPSIISVKTAQQLAESKAEYLTLQIQKAANCCIRNLNLKYEYKVTIWGGLFTFLDQTKLLKELIFNGQVSLIPRLLSVFNQNIEDAESVMNYFEANNFYDKLKSMTLINSLQMGKNEETSEEITDVKNPVGRPTVGDDVENDNTATSLDMGNNVSDIK